MTVNLKIFALFIFTYNFCDAQNSGGPEEYEPTTVKDLYGLMKLLQKSIHISRNILLEHLDTTNPVIKSLKENYDSLLQESLHQKITLQDHIGICHAEIKSMKKIDDALLQEFQLLKEDLHDHIGITNIEIKSMKENYDSVLQESQLQKETLQENYNSLNAEMQVIRENLTLMIGEITSEKEVTGEITSKKEVTESSTTEIYIATTNIMPIDGEGCIRVIEVGSEKFFICTEMFNYTEAKDYCNKWGSHLAQLEDPLAVLNKLISTIGPSGFWIGAHRDADGVFKWTVSGTVIPKEYKYWNFISPGASNNCVFLGRRPGHGGVMTNWIPCGYRDHNVHPVCQLK